MALAGVLLVVQLLPLFRPGAATGATSGVRAPSKLGPSSGPSTGAGPVSFNPHRPASTEQAVMFDPRADGRSLSIVGWQGSHEGSIGLPTVASGVRGWGLSQSPDGSRVLDGTLFMDSDGRTRDLANLIVQPRVSSFTWRDDSAGACALQDEGEETTSLVEFLFNPGQVQLLRFTLPAQFAVHSVVLSCSRAQRTIVVGLVDLLGAVHLLVVDLVTGAEVARRDYPRGSAGTIAGSPDGKLVALNSGRAQGYQTGPLPHTVVREVGDGAVVRDFGTDTIIHGFSADSTTVLVDSPTRPGTAIRRLSDGGAEWSDGSDRQLLGWLARPLTHSFALALGRRDNNTCTKGEPGKFPQFCRFAQVHDLLEVSDTGIARDIGHGHGAWGYDVP